MHTDQLPVPDPEAFERVWRRVMPEDRPDCPVALEHSPFPSAPVPPAPAPKAQTAACLGEASTDQLPALDRLLLLTVESWQSYRTMARSSRRASLPAALAQAKRQQLRRLGAARFLISGTPYELPETEPSQAAPLPLWVRQRYQAEQRTALELLTAASSSADPCLIDLFRALALENQTHAGQLREWLERM